MLTERDKVAISFIEQFKMVTPKQVNEIAYNNQKVCYKRLNKLYTDKLLYRADNVIERGYIYSAKRIRTLKNWTHNKIRTDFYLRLREITVIEDLHVEELYGSIQPDLLVYCTYKGMEYFFSVEVETRQNHSQINYDKYNNYFLREYKEYFEQKPVVVYVTDKKVDDEKIRFNYVHVKSDLSNFIDIFK